MNYRNVFTQKAEYTWTSMERGVVLGMNSLGQILACFSGVAVHRIGGAAYVGIGKLGEAIISLTSPFMIHTHLYLFVMHRLILGLFEVILVVNFIAQEVLLK